MRYCLMLSTFVAPFACLALPLQPRWNETRIMHEWDAVPDNWEYLGYPQASATINLYIALRSYREDALIDALYEVSDPEHPKHVLATSFPARIYSRAPRHFCRYGKHLSQEQVAELVAPHPETFELVHSWLEHKNVPPSSISTTHGGNWLTVTGVPLSQASELLGASYGLYRHVNTNETIIRTLGYALPAVLHPHVLAVAPTTFFASTGALQLKAPRHRPVREAAAQANAPYGELMNVTALSHRDGVPTPGTPPPPMKPSDIRWLYKTFAYTPAATDRNALGFAGFLKEYPSQTDLTTFMTEYRPDAKDATFDVLKVNGGEYNPKRPHIEGNMNVQFASAVAYPTPQTYYSIGGGTKVYDDTGEPAPGDVFLEWFKYVFDQPKIPQTISMSYGVEEKDCPLQYADALCRLFAQLGSRGVSVLCASGNDGVGAGDCKGDDGQVHFSPMFPASLSAARWVYRSKKRGPLWRRLLEFFPLPPYQKKVVPIFLRNLGGKYGGLYNSKGRGIPDVAAQASTFEIVLNNLFGNVVAGTSGATPTVAGVISLLNDFLISNGKQPLGLLNPWLYGKGLPGLIDIVSGSNPGCKQKGSPPSLDGIQSRVSGL
ncbi:peptidase S8/S53 domain-containing protein [Lactarius quietus]|nr:peptidase S8/S53 domain-containing protein [Lactarius quietus]